MPWYWRKYFILTLALTVFLIFVPLFNLVTDTEFIEEIVFMGLMLTTLYTVAHNKTLLIVGMILAAVTLLGTLTTKYSTGTVFISAMISAVILLVLVITIIIVDVVKNDDIEVDMIFGAIAAYLLIGVCWALIYSIVDTLIPDSILINTNVVDEFGPVTGQSNFAFYNYFSFVSMTTLGYGDVIPAHPVTRALATYQAIFGQMFIAILVARLVAMHLTKES